MLNLKYLVVGTGRCGTVFMARLLTSLGISCGHEAIFNAEGIGSALDKLNKRLPIQTSIISNINADEWFKEQTIAADSSHMAVPFLDIQELKSTKIIHIVRNPLAVISSFVIDINFFSPNYNNIWKTFIMNHMPEIDQENTVIEKACRYYINWNNMIKNSDLFLKIEEQPSDKLFDFLEVKNQICFTNTKINSKKQKGRKNLNFEEIPEGKTKKEFGDIIQKYKYEKHLNILI